MHEASEIISRGAAGSLHLFPINNLEGKYVHTQVTNLPRSSIVSVLLFLLPLLIHFKLADSLRDNALTAPPLFSALLHMVYRLLLLLRPFLLFTQ